MPTSPAAAQQTPVQELLSVALASALAPVDAATRAKPKRPLSAYNMFFKEECDKKRSEKKSKRKRGNKCSFQEMTARIGSKWRALDDEFKARYQQLADSDTERYKHERGLYMQQKSEERERIRQQLEASVDEETRERYIASGGNMPVRSKKRAKHAEDQKQAVPCRRRGNADL
jgi:hypothetical protein